MPLRPADGTSSADVILAATAALYVTKSNKKEQPKSNYPLDSDNKLSSASQSPLMRGDLQSTY